jgi:hypothetical protein
MRRALEIGGFVAGAILIAFGIAVIVLGVNGRSTVNSGLGDEKITGTPDMTPAGIRAEVAKAAGLAGISLPTCSVAGQAIDNGTRARCFAQYMRIHALEATGGLTYSQMGQFETPDGKPTGTNDPTKAVQKNGQPVPNAARNVWVTETALSTALNVSYMATQLALFSIVTGVALLLSGVGFVILAYAVLHRGRDESAAVAAAAPAPAPATT